jgi:hypothetical protein
MNAPSDDAALFETGTNALRKGKTSEAIIAFETLSDRGVVDAALSYNRGLAYAERIRQRAEAPGDLGQAIAAFEECLGLGGDSALRERALSALSALRNLVARRAAEAGVSLTTPAPPASLSAAHALSEDVWGGLALGSAVLLAGALLFAKASRKAHRGALALGVTSTLLLGLTLWLGSVAHRDRTTARYAVVVREAVVMTLDARAPGAGGAPQTLTLPPGSRVQLRDDASDRVQISFGDDRGSVARDGLRVLRTLP